MVISPTSIFTAIAALAAVLALIWLAARAARFGGLATRPASGRSLAVEDTISLDARRRLLLVKCDNRRVLLLTGGGNDLVVGWIEPPEAPRE